MDYQTAIRAAAENSSEYFSVSFQAPGRPLSSPRRLHVRLQVSRTIGELAATHGFTVEPVTTGESPERIELTGIASGLDDLCNLQETLIKGAAGRLHADLLDGANVTRLHVMCGCEFPRLGYDEALAVVNARGHSLRRGDGFTPAAMATLVHYCNDLPMHVLKGSRDAVCILPLAGEAGTAVLLVADRAGLTIDLTRTLEYFMGLKSVVDAAGG